jgi:hypothetical protein
MLTKLYTNTGYHWYAVEVDGELRFGLGKYTQAARRTEGWPRLDDAENLTDLIDRSTPIKELRLGAVDRMIDTFIYHDAIDMYATRTQEGRTHEKVLFTPDEVKTMLCA